MNQILMTSDNNDNNNKNENNNINTINNIDNINNINNNNVINSNNYVYDNYTANNVSYEEVQPPKAEYIKPEKKTVNIGTTGIIKIFAIVIMIFGIAIVGNSAYAMVKSAQDSKNNKGPEVTTERKGNSIKVVIKCEQGIRTMMYSWNDSTEKVIFGNNNTELEQELNIPTGENKLNITVVNSKGKQTKFVKNFIQEEKDTIEPIIKIDNVNSDIRIVVTDDTALDYIIYKYGDDREVKIEANEDDPTTIESLVTTKPGQYTLKIEAVDKAQNHATKEQEVKGVNKPIIDVVPDATDPSYLIIKATDEEGLRMVSFYINDQEYKTDPNTSLNTKVFEWRQKVERGESTVRVNAYSINEQVATFNGIYNY